MERLTVFDGEFWVHKNFPPVGEDTVDEFMDCVKELAERLAAYEDTGLKPEQINWLCDMDRRAKMADLLRLEEYQELGPIDHLRELVQAEKDGRVCEKEGKAEAFAPETAAGICSLELGVP